ncbi:hypothetical protein L3X38_009639 [Prunus dulcis]|uniref:Uncharacterized protein n=1 Tax=Prunus dulcis TaxID=3755 RepID=A0AAD4WFM3_PRUDU|nr:hypothetical protein L3X38_009639 [Prunus dulcis]
MTYLGTPIYNTVLHSLFDAKESQMAIKILKNTKSFGFPADSIYLRIGVHDVVRWLLSTNSDLYHSHKGDASISFAELMVKLAEFFGYYCRFEVDAAERINAIEMDMARYGIQHSYLSMKNLVTPYPHVYFLLLKALGAEGMIRELIQYLDVAENIFCRNNIYLGTPIYNTVLHSLVEAQEVGVFITIGFHSTDPATCHFFFSAYANSGFHSTAMEALQVLNMRMICEEDGSFPEKAEFEDDFIFAEDLEAESRIVQLFKDSEEKLAVALLNLRWKGAT